MYDGLYFPVREASFLQSGSCLMTLTKANHFRDISCKNSFHGFINFGDTRKKAFLFFLPFCFLSLAYTNHRHNKSITDFYFLLPENNIFCLLLCPQLPQYVLLYVKMTFSYSMIVLKRLHKDSVLFIVFDMFLHSNTKVLTIS